MAKYRLSNAAREDLIRIHQFGVRQFGMAQADAIYYRVVDSRVEIMAVIGKQDLNQSIL